MPRVTGGCELSAAECGGGAAVGCCVRCMPRVTGGCELSAAGVAAGACTFFAMYAASHWWA